ncbi:hypothetical protein [Nocardioides renjunii]|uniref:hypothetical protein n=1 Tax=Nocardioides renjunii TaxID=3095075 RepID=UPI002AFEFFDC|nr:hypothetical protein [Nocardioides sp. S-34]WQQ22076.1 hypothetical protein SHK17_19570 [Nocardioides sp. S-34]
MRARTTLALALAVALAGCSADDPAPRSAPSGGPLEDPVAVEPTPALLDWQDTGVAAGTPYAKGPKWDASTVDGRSRVDLRSGDRTLSVAAGRGRTISEVLMDAGRVVVVRQDTAERASSRVTVVDLASGDRREITQPPAASGGSWALTGGDLHYPTYGDARAYCLATYALDDDNGEDGWCAPARTGFSGLTASEHGIGVMTFDDGRPVACRTANLLDDAGTPQPVEGPVDCVAWDVAATADGAVWSEVTDPSRQEEAHFRASADGAFFDLGPGTTGSLVPCGDSVFFVRDPQDSDEPARLVRWTPDRTLEVAYESASVGNAFLGEPACAEGVLTLSAFGEEGDESVWASVAE